MGTQAPSEPQFPQPPHSLPLSGLCVQMEAMWQRHCVNCRRISHKGDRALIPSAANAAGPPGPPSGPGQKCWLPMAIAEFLGPSLVRGSHSNAWTRPPILRNSQASVLKSSRLWLCQLHLGLVSVS